MRRLLVVFSAILCLLQLSGCGLFMLGGAAAGGYYVGNDSRSVGTIADDANTTTAINMNYVGDDLIRTFDIDVDTHDGVVTLTGTVPSREVEQRAVRLAQVSGVRKVISHLRIGR